MASSFVYVMAFTRSHFEEALNVLASIGRSHRDSEAHPSLDVHIYAPGGSDAMLQKITDTMRAHSEGALTPKVSLHSLPMSMPAEADYGTALFTKIVQIKLLALKATLAKVPATAHVVWLDTDLFFKHDVRGALLRAVDASPTACALFQSSRRKVCSGFFMLPGNATREYQHTFLHNTHQRLIAHITSGSQDYMDDETCFNQEILSQRPSRVAVLDARMFPNGEVYFKKGIRDHALMIHNNFIKGLQAKIERFKAHGLWII